MASSLSFHEYLHAIRSRRRRPPLSAGLAHVRQACHDDNDDHDVHAAVRAQLQTLWRDTLPWSMEDDDDAAMWSLSSSSWHSTTDSDRQHAQILHALHNTPPDWEQNEIQTRRQAYMGDISLFAAVLHVVDKHDGDSVPTKTLLKSCCAAVPPQYVPATLDARDVVLAVIVFLCAACMVDEDDNDSSPLLTLHGSVDLDRALVRKQSNWRWPLLHHHALAQLAAWEQAFWHDATHFTWLARQHHLPTGTYHHDVVEAVLLKGTWPAAPRKPGKKKAHKVGPAADDDDRPHHHPHTDTGSSTLRIAAADNNDQHEAPGGNNSDDDDDDDDDDEDDDDDDEPLPAPPPKKRARAAPAMLVPPHPLPSHRYLMPASSRLSSSSSTSSSSPPPPPPPPPLPDDDDDTS